MRLGWAVLSRHWRSSDDCWMSSDGCWRSSDGCWRSSTDCWRSSDDRRTSGNAGRRLGGAREPRRGVAAGRDRTVADSPRATRRFSEVVDQRPQRQFAEVDTEPSRGYPLRKYLKQRCDEAPRPPAEPCPGGNFDGVKLASEAKAQSLRDVSRLGRGEHGNDPVDYCRTRRSHSRGCLLAHERGLWPF